MIAAASADVHAAAAASAPEAGCSRGEEAGAGAGGGEATAASQASQNLRDATLMLSHSPQHNKMAAGPPHSEGAETPGGPSSHYCQTLRLERLSGCFLFLLLLRPLTCEDQGATRVFSHVTRRSSVRPSEAALATFVSFRGASCVFFNSQTPRLK